MRDYGGSFVKVGFARELDRFTGYDTGNQFHDTGSVRRLGDTLIYDHVNT